jgi:hypothetical protein
MPMPILTLRSTLVRRSAAVAAAAALSLGLTACSDDESSEDANERAAQAAEEALSELNQPEEDADADDAEDTPVNDPGEPQITADKTQDLSDGDTITVTVRGLDAEGGYYLGICKAGTGADAAGEGGAPDCTGGREDSKWITAEGSDQGTDHVKADGTAEVELTVAEQGDAVDCSTDKCIIKVFGDHTNGFNAVAEAPVTFAS